MIEYTQKTEKRMMAKDTMTMNEQTKIFAQAVDYFFGMNPKNSDWLLLMLFLSKERALRVVENYSEQNEENVMVRLCIDDIFDKKVVEKWEKLNLYNKCIILDTQSNYVKGAVDLIDEICKDSTLYYGLNDEKNNIFRVQRWEPTYLFQVVESLMSLSDSWYEENASSAYDTIIRRMQNVQGIKSSGLVVQPNEITELVIRLLGARSGSVYNPYAGICSYATMLSNDCQYYGQEASTQAYILGRLNLLINRKDNARLERSDISNQWSAVSSQCFDYIVSTPPFGLKLPDGDHRTAELDFLVHASKHAAKKSVGIYTSNMCTNASLGYGNLYKDIVCSDVIELVILLPRNTLSFTAIAPVIIVTNRDKKNHGMIRFVDASEMYVANGRGHSLNFIDKFLDRISADNVDDLNWVIDVSLEDMSSLGYNLFPKSYLWKPEIKFPEGYVQKEFGEVAEICKGSRAVERESGFVAKISNLADSALNCEKRVEEFEYTENIATKANVTKVEEHVILVALDKDAKPTYCKASPFNPVFIHPNIVAFRIKADWVSPYYLCYELDRRISKMGDGFGFVHPKDRGVRLMSTTLAFPSYNRVEQDKIAAEARLQYKEEKAREMGLQEVIDKMKAEYIYEIRTRKHDMRPHLRNLRSTERLIRHYLTASNDMSEMTEKICGLLDRWKVSLEQLSNLVDIFSDENHFGTPEFIDLHKYFLELVSHYDIETHGFEMKYECDSSALEEIGFVRGNSASKEYSMLNGLVSFKYEKSSGDFALFTHIASIDLDRLVTNIVENAREHGFTNNQRSDYMVMIHLSVDPKRQMYQIDFINNGIPLPAGLDKLRYGMRGEKAGATGRSGNGGYVVKSVAEHYKGDFDVFMDDMGTVIRVLLPITEHNNE